MAKTESTAVNNLIDLVQANQGRRIIDPDEDLFAAPKKPGKQPTPARPQVNVNPPRMTGALPSLRGTGEVPPLPRSRAPGGTSQLTLPEHASQVRMTTAPPTRGTTVPPIPQRASAPAPRKPDSTPAPVRVTAAPVRVTPQPIVPSTLLPHSQAVDPASLAAVAPLSYPVAAQPQAIDRTGDVVRGEPWFEASRAVEKFEGDTTYVGTSPHVLQDRRNGTAALIKKLILPGLGFIVVGALIGGFIAFNTGGKKHAAAPASAVAAAPAPVAEAVSAPAPTPAPVPVAEVATAAPAPAPARPVVQLADVRIDSLPSGATVTLVEKTAAGDKRSFLGTTPLSTSLDPAHSYDVELALDGRPTEIAHLDPAKTPHLAVTLGTPVKAAPAPAAPKHHAAAKVVASSVPTGGIADPGFDSKPVAEKPVVAEGTGTLMISSKPPCEIVIDGKPTGLSTPQRAMSLPAGAHKVTLVNSAENISKTMLVEINANQATKLVKDLLAN